MLTARAGDCSPLVSHPHPAGEALAQDGVVAPVSSAAIHFQLTSSALDDIQASINELRFYQRNVFVPLESDAPTPDAHNEPLKTAL